MRPTRPCCVPGAPTLTSTWTCASSTSNDPDAVEEQTDAANARHLRRDGADHAGEGRRDPLPRRGRHRLRAPHPGPHAPDPWPTSSTASTSVFVGDAVQIHGAANGFPGYEDPAAYRASLQYLRDEVRPAAPVPRATRTANADGVPYGVELDREAGPASPAGEPGHRGQDRRRRPRLPGAGLQETDSVYSPFAPVAEELGYTGDPTLEPSPFFTTMHGYRTQFNHDVTNMRSFALMAEFQTIDAGGAEDRRPQGPPRPDARRRRARRGRLPGR